MNRTKWKGVFALGPVPGSHNKTRGKESKQTKNLNDLTEE